MLWLITIEIISINIILRTINRKRNNYDDRNISRNKTSLNDRLVETYQGNANLRVHIESGQHTLQNYQSCDHTVSEIVQYGQDLAKASYDLSQKNDLHQYEDLLSILEDMAEAVSQVQYHLSLK